MTTSFKKTLFFCAFAASILARADESIEVWQIETRGFSGQHSTTAKLNRINGKLYIDYTTLVELGYPLNHLTPDESYTLDSVGVPSFNHDDSTILLNVKPEFLPVTAFTVNKNAVIETSSDIIPALVINYETNATTERYGSNGLLLDASYYFAGKYQISMQGSAQSTGNMSTLKWSRLGTNISYADPVKMYSWSLGDAVSTTGNNINPVSFTGFQFKKDYALQPGFVVQPVTELKGSAAMPSTLDVYLDNRRVMSGMIPAGPFSVRNIVPQVGVNNATIVVRDAFGQEQVINESFTGSSSLLRQGYTNYAVQVGQFRTYTSGNEGFFTSGFFSKGISDDLTIEVNGETSKESLSFPSVHHYGASVFFATKLGSLSFNTRRGTGSSIRVGYMNGWRDSDFNATVSASKTQNSEDYRIMGFLDKPSRQSSTLQSSVQWARGRMLSLYRLGNDQGNTLGISLSLTTFEPYKPMYSISADKSTNNGRSNKSVSFSMSIPFNYVSRNRSQNVSTGLRYQPEAGTFKSFDFYNATLAQVGTNYHVRAEKSSAYKRIDSEITKMTYGGDINMALSSLNGQVDTRARLRGSAIISKEGMAFDRWLTGGFARVDTALPDTTVLINGSAVGKTNGVGIAYVPVSMPYTKTIVSLDQGADPSLDTTPIEIVVAPRGGVNVKFNRITGTMLTIKSAAFGTLSINGQLYPITDRGVYLELPEGRYIGILNNGRKITFEIPKPGKANVQYVNVE